MPAISPMSNDPGLFWILLYKCNQISHVNDILIQIYSHLSYHVLGLWGFDRASIGPASCDSIMGWPIDDCYLREITHVILLGFVNPLGWRC